MLVWGGVGEAGKRESGIMGLWWVGKKKKEERSKEKKV